MDILGTYHSILLHLNIIKRGMKRFLWEKFAYLVESVWTLLWVYLMRYGHGMNESQSGLLTFFPSKLAPKNVFWFLFWSEIAWAEIKLNSLHLNSKDRVYFQSINRPKSALSPKLTLTQSSVTNSEHNCAHVSIFQTLVAQKIPKWRIF